MLTAPRPEGPSRGLDLVLAALDASLDRTKAALAVLVLALAASSGFVVLLLASVVGDTLAAGSIIAFWLLSMWLLNALVVGTVTRLTFTSMVGDDETSLGDAVEFARQRLIAYATAPLVVLIVVVFLMALQWLVLQAYRLPVLGEFALAVLFLPLVLLNMCILSGTVVALWLVPGTLAATGDGALRSIRSSIYMMVRLPGRILVHVIATVAVIVVVGGALGILLWLAVTQTLALAALAGGEAAQAGGIVEIVAELGLSGFPEGGEPDVITVATLIVYVLYTALLVAFIAMVPLYVFPLCASCAAWIDAVGADTVGPGAVDTGAKSDDLVAAGAGGKDDVLAEAAEEPAESTGEDSRSGPADPA